MTQTDMQANSFDPAQLIDTIKNFGESFHGAQQSIDLMRTEMRNHHEFVRSRDDAMNRRVDSILDSIRSLERQMDARFDHVWKTIDEIRTNLSDRISNAELRAKLAELETRLAEQEAAVKGEHDARVTELTEIRRSFAELEALFREVAAGQGIQ